MALTFSTTKSTGSNIISNPRTKKWEEESKKHAIFNEQEKRKEDHGIKTPGLTIPATDGTMVSYKDDFPLPTPSFVPPPKPSANKKKDEDNPPAETNNESSTEKDGESKKSDDTTGGTGTSGTSDEKNQNTDIPSVPTTPIVPTTPAARSYESAYADEIDRLLLELRNREAFSYDHESDPRYSAYKKEYLREADRTAEDTMGLYAGMTGGMPSTAAVSAASQAANQYKAGLADKIPELYQLAYDTYLDEIAQSRRDLETLRDLDNTAYNRWYTENRDAIADARYADETAYNRKIYEEETEYNRQLAELARAAQEQEALIAEWKKGGTVLSKEQAAATGYPEGVTYKQYEASLKGSSGISDEDIESASNALRQYSYYAQLGDEKKAAQTNTNDIFDSLYISAKGDGAVFDNAIREVIGDDEYLKKIFADWHETHMGRLQ